LLKIYTLPNHTIPIGVCIFETQLLGLLYGGGPSFVQKWSMPWMSANVPFLYSLISMIGTDTDMYCNNGITNDHKSRKHRYILTTNSNTVFLYLLGF
jgi:hypothetical protein